MLTFFMIFALLLIIIALMSIGVIFSGKPIAGSCGGASKLISDDWSSENCPICGKTKICNDSQKIINKERLT